MGAEAGSRASPRILVRVTQRCDASYAHALTRTPTLADGDDVNSFWVVKPAHGGSCEQGTRIKNGQSVRLQHLETKRWLHSHSHRSPLSGQQEVRTRRALQLRRSCVRERFLQPRCVLAP
jgi:hypothetical protein